MGSSIWLGRRRARPAFLDRLCIHACIRVAPMTRRREAITDRPGNTVESTVAPLSNCGMALTILTSRRSPPGRKHAPTCSPEPKKLFYYRPIRWSGPRAAGCANARELTSECTRYREVLMIRRPGSVSRRQPQYSGFVPILRRNPMIAGIGAPPLVITAFFLMYPIAMRRFWKAVRVGICRCPFCSMKSV